MSHLFGAIRQVAYVTDDIDAKIDFLLNTAGIGPWFVRHGVVSEGCVYRGTPIELKMTVAFANSGTLQLEIIQPASTGPSMLTDWLASTNRSDDIHHYSSWPENYDEVERNALARGYGIVQQGQSRNGRYTFFEHPSNPRFVFEIAEPLPARRALYDSIYRAAIDWDGRDPIRDWPSA